MISDGVRTKGNIKFVAVGRALNRDVVASLTVGKNDSAEQYHTAVREVLSAPDFSNKVSAGARYRLVGEVNAFNFTTDNEHRVYIVISAFDYPERLVFSMINELVVSFKQELGPQSLTCPAGALDSKARKIFQKMAEEYDDPTKRDKLMQVQAQVQGVKLTMGKNLNNMLKNIDKARNIEESSSQLQAQAAKFDEQAKTLKRRELCRKWQTTALIVIAIAIVIVVVVVAFVGPSVGGGATNPPATSPPNGSPAAATPAPTSFRRLQGEVQARFQ